MSWAHCNAHDRAGKALTATQLRGHVLGLLLAGNETAAAANSSALVHGARTPTEWTRLRADPAHRTTPFLTESLRLSPAVWGIPRTPTKPGLTLSAERATARIRRGQVATIYLHGINRDPERWPDPSRFDPSRYDRPTAEQHRSLIPFGLGPRGCIGQHLALAEMNAALPRLAQHETSRSKSPSAKIPASRYAPSPASPDASPLPRIRPHRSARRSHSAHSRRHFRTQTCRSVLRDQPIGRAFGRRVLYLLESADRQF
jgi:cytochrome P450